MSWPNTIDGDVFRSLESHHFNFSKEHEIEINIDFNDWPLELEAINEIKELFPNCEFIEPDEENIENGENNGYVQYYIIAPLSYELIISTQQEVTEKVKHLGGWCDSWGVMTH